VRFRFVSSITRSLIVRVTLPARPVRISRRAGPVGENAAAYSTLLSRKILLAGFGATIGLLQEISADVASLRNKRFKGEPFFLEDLANAVQGFGRHYLLGRYIHPLAFP
jgi:hypothetical protein